MVPVTREAFVSALAGSWDLRAIVVDADDPAALTDVVSSWPEVGRTQYLTELGYGFGFRTQAAELLDGGVVVTTLAVPEAGSGATSLGALVVTLATPEAADLVAAKLRDLPEVFEVEYSVTFANAELEALFALATRDAATIPDERFVIQPAIGPAPAFDVSELGDEVLLDPWSVGGPAITTLLPAGILRPEGPQPDIDRPILHIGSLETGERLVVFATQDGNVCRVTVEPGGSGSAGCGRLNIFDNYGVEGWSSTSGPDGTSAIVDVRVPYEAAVAAILADGVELWQRPIAGYAMVPMPSEPGEMVVRAYDTDGTLIGEWTRDH